MPSLDLSKSVFSAGGTAATDWGAASGSAEVTVRGAAELKRGINLDVGAQVLASVDLGLSQFLTAQLSGEAQAQAALTAQVQVPMNLFGEVGLAVRLEAIAELAAAVRASVGLSIGDFIALVEQTPEMAGLPAQLFRVFLEEVEVSAGLFAKAALTAQAYADLVITGTALDDPARGLRPGFNIVAGLGAGLKAGAGFRLFARLGIQDFSRLVGRSVDLLVDAVAEQVAAGVPIDDPGLAQLVDAARAPCKIALRAAYELGDFLTRQNPPRDADGARAVALRCGQVVLEESQRFLLSKAVEAGLSELQSVLSARASADAAAWNAAIAQRRALADRLAAMPAQPFEGTAANLTYWSQVVGPALDLAGALGLGTDATIGRGLSILWAAGQLAVAAAARVVRASGSVSIIGLPTRTAHESFTGDLASQPPAAVAGVLRARLGLAGGAALKKEHLVDFLADATVLDLVRRVAPGAEAFLDAFRGPIGASPNDIARALLGNAGAVVRDGAGQLDDVATLTALADSLRAFVHEQVAGVIAPAVRSSLPASTDVKTLVDEVLVPSALFAVDTVFDQALRWSRDAVPTSQVTEALSGIVMKVLGRSVVAAGDVLLATVQQQLSGILNELADHIDDPGGIVSLLAGNPAAGMAAEDIADLLAEVLRIGAEVYGPLPSSQRQRLRALMYQVIDPLPAAGGGAFLDELARDNFVPQFEAISALGQELGTIGVERFFRLVELLIERIGLKLLEDLAEAIEGAAQLVVDLAAEVIAALGALGQRLLELVAEIAALAQEVAERFAEAADALLESLASLDTTTGRNRLKDGLVDSAVGAATDLLESNDIYKHWVPADIKGSVESTMRSALRSALNTGVVSVILDAVGVVASSLDDLVDDVRELDANAPLAPQLLELVLDRIEDAVEGAFGDDPRIDLEFEVSWQYTVVEHVGPAPWDFATRNRTASYAIDLGRIDIPLDDVLAVVRQVGRGLGAVEAAIEAAAGKLAAAFAAEQQLQARETEKAGLETEQATLEKRRAETAPGTRSVAILSPARMQVVDRPTSVRVRIEGVPESIVEEGEEAPPRLLVFLNGEPVPLSRFTVAPLAGSGPGKGGLRGLGLPAHPITGAALRGNRAVGGAKQLRGHGGHGAAGLALAREVLRERAVARLLTRHAGRLGASGGGGAAARSAGAAPGGVRPGELSGVRDVVTPSDAVSRGGGAGRDRGLLLGGSGATSIRGLGRPISGVLLGDVVRS
ncbi:MAG: hypothetical protein HYY95_25560, partial [Candidatus Rokubacteria bacterium]|nr:hypothetical protein [Candidatus Rokubacteria bacterium]